ncbi:MAG: hypothetical protein ACKVPX_15090 [Myxococcaceae bacterium]
MWRILTSGFVALLLLVPQAAHAYVWMIRHGQTGCTSCHADPSGGGILTPYGRAQSSLLLPPRGTDALEDSEGEEGEEKEAERGGFMFGLLKLPDWFNTGISIRAGGLYTRAGDLSSIRPVQMVTDIRAMVDYAGFQAAVTFGYAIRGALQAALTGAPGNNLVSREHWVGLASEDESLRVRAGRLTLPFGLRVPEHTLWVRETTRTNTNEHQQHGVAVSYASEQVRSEVMAVLGNLQLNPAEYRERGYAGYVEWAPRERFALGLSSLVLYAHYDLETRSSSYLRQAHGLFGRWSVVPPLVFMAEADVLLAASLGEPLNLGVTEMVQLDWEILQGVHLFVTGEGLHRGGQSDFGGWLAVAYFVMPQIELRLDATLRSLQESTGRTSVFSLFAQVHLSI